MSGPGFAQRRWHPHNNSAVYPGWVSTGPIPSHRKPGYDDTIHSRSVILTRPAHSVHRPNPGTSGTSKVTPGFTGTPPTDSSISAWV